jgi:phospholipid/cholesterol/gamma-HCH transport system substrate-binding protein
MRLDSREVRVGLLLLVALAVAAGSIFVLGEKSNLFKSKNRYHVELKSASGLKQGNPVELDGVDVGVVKKIVLPRDPNQAEIQIWIEVDRSYADRIRGPQGGQKMATEAGRSEPESKARIKTLGLLGAKFVEISSGSPRFPVIPAEGEIPAAAPTNVDALIASGEDVMDNVVAISHSLNTILGRMERGEGLLGELTSSSESGGRLRDSLLHTADSLDRIATKVDSGQGPLPRLLNDRAMGDQLASSLDRFEALLAKAEGVEGALPALLNDPGMRTRVDDTLASLSQASRDLHQLTAAYEQGQGLVPKLVKDDEYGKRVSEQLQQLVEHLNEVSRKLSQGDGTASKLINDPQVYDGVKDILVGVNESRLLRWLIRNRQKAGIEKRYRDTRKALDVPTSPPPSPPADAPPPPV